MRSITSKIHCLTARVVGESVDHSRESHLELGISNTLNQSLDLRRTLTGGTRV